MKAWDPNWRALPPVKPVDRSGAAPAALELGPDERLFRRRQYRRMHLEPVLEAEAKRRVESGEEVNGG